ncbi:MAG: polysaccharide deacetylase [Lachnospiraceae bacterium]|jgi:peptidoglycan/xylan/chitin deacetylase (PgdA/CDA1 family)|nr:polysaccharide deacetylase [Lachnospiraceae bacterium]
MSDNPITGMREQQRRRQRINRMKSALLWIIILWMIGTMTACVVLGVRVFSLHKKIDKIYNYLTSSSGNAVMTYLDNMSMTEESLDTDAPIIYDMNKQELIDDEKAQKVYLTFDDGPSENTEQILDVLKKYKVKATFFVVGRTDEHSLEMYKRIVKEGHTLGLHSYSHKYSSIYKSLHNFKKDLKKLSDLVYDTTGVRAKYMRFPGGSSNQVSDISMKKFIELVTKEGYTYYDWNVVSGDATTIQYTPDELRENVISGVTKHQNSVVLMHDAPNKTSTVEALPKMIEELQAQEYQLLPIDENTKVIQHVSVEDVVND